MRVLLRQTTTGHFFQAINEWTPSREEAMVFRHGGEAVYLVHQLKLQHVEILLAFDDPRYDIHLSLGESPASPPENGLRT
jgi:hypothetical protein